MVQRSPSDAFQSVGKTLGKYRILDGLALGGMAEIYLARVVSKSAEEQHVVIKQILPHRAQNPELVDMFLREARLASTLQHQNIGRVFDIGEHDGLYYFSMEYLHGYDARALFDRLTTKSKRVPYAHALTLITQVAEGLHYAHEHRDDNGTPLGIVHRDVSPSNMFITYDGDVKLVDFGMALVADQSDQRSDMIKGKSSYLSPEQCLNQPLDRRSDVFSLGIVLYELTTGSRLFRTQRDNNYTIMNRIIKGDITPPSALPQFQNDPYPVNLEDVVMQALATDKNQRYPNAKALAIELEAVANVEGFPLSGAGLAQYMANIFGQKIEPWRELSTEFDDDEAFDLPSIDEFDDEVATSLYTGKADDIQDAWAAEAVGQHVPRESNRISLSRMSLPLQAEDSDLFKNPLEPEIVIAVGGDDDTSGGSVSPGNMDTRDPSDPSLHPPTEFSSLTAPGPTSQPRDISTIGHPSRVGDPSQSFQLPPLLPQPVLEEPPAAKQSTMIVILLVAVIAILAAIFFLVVNA